MGEPTGSQRARPRVVALTGLALAVLVVDIVSKAIVVATLSSRPPVRLLGGLLTLVESRNPGAAFSLGGPSETIVFSAIAVGVVIFIVRSARRIYSLAWAVALGLLLGGATGNLTDRIFRSPGLFRGWVVDWIELPHWPIFNVADSAITCGGVLMVALALLGHGIEGKARPAAAEEQPPRPAPQSRQPTAGQAAAGPLQPEQPGAGSSAPGQAAAGPSEPEQPGAGSSTPGQAAAGPSEPEQPGAGSTPGQAAAEQAGAKEPVPDQDAAERPALGQSAPEQSAPEPAQGGQCRPEWPEPESSGSQWPRRQWPEPEPFPQEHPARGTGG